MSVAAIPISSVRFRVLALAVVAGCTTGPRDCTAIGCVSGLEVRSPRGVGDVSVGTLTVCVEGDCHSDQGFSFGGPESVEIIAIADIEPGDAASAVLEMPDGSRYGAEADIERIQPNGDGCPPVCAYVALQLQST